MRNKQILEMMNEIGEKMTKQTAKIKEWKVEHLYDNYYTLVGKIYDHPRFKKVSENDQQTSALVSIDFKNKTAETKNTIYILEN